MVRFGSVPNTRVSIGLRSVVAGIVPRTDVLSQEETVKVGS